MLVLWDGHLARPLYFGAGETPTLQESSLDSATPVNLQQSKLDSWEQPEVSEI
ncbi:hypothetical protein [Nostoc sp.]|uniref:hypothetical protein n=1 Tax=Nostoc sp. TaxID=1180 RepID=UPI002FF81714